MMMDQWAKSGFGSRAAQGAKPKATIVSDVLLYREGLSASLVREGRIAVIDCLGSRDALLALSRNRPDVLLLDGAEQGCLALARKVRSHFPSIPIVGFGISGDDDRLVDCVEAGLTAFVGSQGDVALLVKTVLGALNGELECSPRVSALLCDRLSRLAAGPIKVGTLTRREREIAELIGLGLSNKEIANDLKIGAATVKNHVHSILEKLDVPRRSAIVQRLVQPLPPALPIAGPGAAGGPQ